MVVCPKITLCCTSALLPARRTNQPINGIGLIPGISARIGIPPQYLVGIPNFAFDSYREISLISKLDNCTSVFMVWRIEGMVGSTEPCGFRIRELLT